MFYFKIYSKKPTKTKKKSFQMKSQKIKNSNYKGIL